MVDLQNTLSRVQVWKRGWSSPVYVDAVGIQASTAIASPGRLSCIVPTRDQPYTGIDWEGKWALWEHPTFGLIGGYVEDAPIDTDRGTVELSIPGFINILNHRRTPRQYTPPSGTPGALVDRTLSDVKLDAGMAFAFTVSDRGPVLTVEYRGGMVMEALNSLASSSGQEWVSYLTRDKVLHFDWRERVGFDRSTEVVLTEGVNIISATIAQTIANTVNDLLGIADDDQYARAAGARVISAGSRGAFGLLQGTRQYKGLVEKATLGPRVTAELKYLALPTVTIDIKVPHLEPRLALLTDGTIFRFVSKQANAIYKARVLARSLALDDGIVTLTCDAVQDITRATKQAPWAYGGISTAQVGA